MKNILKHITFLLLGVAAVSCDFEDMPFDKYDSDFVFSNDKKAEGYVLGVYLGLPFDKSDENGYNRVDGAMLASASDEAMITVPGSSIVFLTDGSLTPRKNNPDGCWNDCYKFIRDANIGIVGLEKLPEANHDLKLQLQAELKFLKAFFYFELVKRYGGVPLLDRSYELSEDLNVSRSSLADCIDYITRLCDEACEQLPDPNNVSFGRASKGAALALKARTLLYAASPLYNGKGYDGSDNRLICYGTYDKSRWELAAAAAADVIRLGDYDIYKPAAIAEAAKDDKVIADGSANYRKLFTVIAGNKELILPRTSKAGNRVEIQNFPVGIPNGKGLTSPSQQMVDAYGTVTGRSIDDPGSLYDRKNPYENRDPRFYASIFHNGQNWNGTTIETFQGGVHNNTNTSTKTGYYMSKFCGSEVVISGTPTNTNHCFPLFRYAEILLDYAEAANEAYGPDVDPLGCGLTARDALKLVRSRVLRPSQTDVDVASGDSEGMSAAIRRERRVELAFEDHRYYDVKRWKIADEVLSEGIRGVRITRSGDTFSYQVLENVNSRQFTPKFYLYPIPNDDVANNSAIRGNNPLW